MRDVLNALVGVLENGGEALVCQVVETRGSTPQKAGALMVIDPAGRQFGTLGGGCVEAEVRLRAMRRIGQPEAELHTFVLDHDYAWADGLICGGRMSIIVEAVSGDVPRRYYQAYRHLIETGGGLIEAIVIDAERVAGMRQGARWLNGPDGCPVIAYGLSPAKASSMEIPDRLGKRPLAQAGIAWLPVPPRVQLVIVGAGHVGQAVGELAAKADFDVWVVDDRAQYASADRFPTAQRLMVGPIEETLRSLEFDRNTYALVVTRGHGHDQQALECLAPTDAGYVGLIGSRRKIKMIFENLRQQGIDAEKLARVAAPVGLDIGSESVFEIAVSIVAELIARRNTGGLPRYRETSPQPESEPALP